MKMYRDQEVWRKLAGPYAKFKDYYVSSYGRVASLKRGGIKVLKPFSNNDGYFSIDLWQDGFKKSSLVHRLVASSFLGGYFKGLHVNHKDLNKQNNNVYNLEWVTSKQNSQHAVKNGVQFSKRKLTEEECNQIRLLFSEYTMPILAKRFKVGVATIHRVINKQGAYHTI